MSTFQQSHKENMAEFFRDPNREVLRQVLRTFDGEYDELDFKSKWIDNPKVAKHVLAMANSGGGVIVFGVTEKNDGTYEMKGLDELKDEADLSINQYLPDEATDIYNLESYDYGPAEWEEIEESLFQVLFIDDRPDILPLISQKSSGNDINRDTIYVRRNTKSIRAQHSDLNRILDRRISAQLKHESGDLRKDLNQLMALYDQLPKNHIIELPEYIGELPESASVARPGGFLDQTTPGKRMEFYRFVKRKIRDKEEQVEHRLGLR